VLLSRTILAIALGVSMLLSTAPAAPSAHQAAPAGRDCCHRDKDTCPMKQKSNGPCHDSSCVMQCCRVLPVQADARPVLARAALALAVEMPAPIELRTLTNPDLVFHPPRSDARTT
jgi:hypothetical protein